RSRSIISTRSGCGQTGAVVMSTYTSTGSGGVLNIAVHHAPGTISCTNVRSVARGGSVPFWIVEPAGAPSHTPWLSSPSQVVSSRQCGVVGYLKYWTVTGRPDTARAYRRFGVAEHVSTLGVWS